MEPAPPVLPPQDLPPQAPEPPHGPEESADGETIPLEPLALPAGPQTSAVTEAEKRPRERSSDSRERLREARIQLRHAKKLRRRREREERRRFTKHSRARRRRVMVVLGALTILALFVGVGLFTPVMSVRHVEIVGASRVPKEEITAALDGVSGEPLALVSDDRVFEALQAFDLIETYAIEKIPPSTLRIVINEREPVVAVLQGDAFVLMDPSGVTIDTVSADELPDTIPVFRGAPSDPSSPVFREVSRALRNMPFELKGLIHEVSANTPQQITLVLRTGLRVIWGDASETRRKAVVFTAMLEALGEETPASVIDVSAPGAPVYVP